jgi:nucleoside-diphosphate-sugar epimerase/DNA-binding response OmpR family regulator
MNDTNLEKLLLVVEDDNRLRKQLALSLKKYGKVEAFESGIDAIKGFIPGKYHVAILDIKGVGVTDEEDGVDLAERIRSLDPSLQIIFYTGYPNERGGESEITGQTLPGTDYVTKGENISQLNAKVTAGMQATILTRKINTQINEKIKEYGSLDAIPEIIINKEDPLGVKHEQDQLLKLSRLSKIFSEIAGTPIPGRNYEKMRERLEQLRTLKDVVILTTGASNTGLVGPLFLQEVLSRVDSYYGAPIIRGNNGESVKRLPDILKPFHDQQRITVYNGDITRPLAGLKPADIEDLKHRNVVIVHSGASTDFSWPRWADTMLTNLGGTWNMLQLSNLIKPFMFYHVSTIYRVGTGDNLPDVIPSAISDGDYLYENPYGWSKNLAEQVVNLYAAGQNEDVSFVIARLDALLGDSVTGDSDRKTLYAVTEGVFRTKQIMDKYNLGNVLRIRTDVVNPEGTKNFMHIDKIVKTMMVPIFLQNDTPNRIFHLTNDHYDTWHDIMSAMCRTVGLQYVPVDTLDYADMNQGEKFLHKKVLPYFGTYLTSKDKHFDRTSTELYMTEPTKPIDFDFVFQSFLNNPRYVDIFK